MQVEQGRRRGNLMLARSILCATAMELEEHNNHVASRTFEESLVSLHSWFTCERRCNTQSTETTSTLLRTSSVTTAHHVRTSVKPAMAHSDLNSSVN
jgi:hypothetical protein